MVIKEDLKNTALKPGRDTLVSWSENYATGIELIDNQHRELVNLTNQLFKACLSSDVAANTVFREAMSRMVEYVRFHFTAELELLAKINYPDYAEHKKQHDQLIQMIFNAAKKYNEGKTLVPNQFVRDLKEWVFGHIAIWDKKYAYYAANLKSQGLLTDQMLQ